MSRAYLVTGGAGFIGSHLTEALVEAGNTVRVLDDFSTGNRGHLARAIASNRCELVDGDIRQPDRVGKALRGVEGVFHLAALVSVPLSVERPLDSFAVNCGGTINLLEQARKQGVRRVVLASSAAVYGDGGESPLSESLAPKPDSPYALEKWYGEEAARLYHRLFGLETISLRFFNVYGLRQDPSSPYSGVISRFLGDLASGTVPVIFGDGEQSRDFIHVSDTVRACISVMEAPYAGYRRYNVAGGASTTINRLFAEMKRLSGASGNPRHEEARPGDVRHSLADPSLIEAEVGFSASVSLEQGLKELVRESVQNAGSVENPAPAP